MLHKFTAHRLAVCVAFLGSSAFVLADPLQTGVTGTVNVWPAHPGPQRAGERSTAAAAGALVELRNPQDKVVASAVADAQGQYRLLAPAGSYQVNAKFRGSVFPRCKSMEANVSASHLAQVDIVCDSGMR